MVIPCRRKRISVSQVVQRGLLCRSTLRIQKAQGCCKALTSFIDIESASYLVQNQQRSTQH